MNLYEILGVPFDATADQIHQAYRRLARDLHPDRNSSPEAHQRMLQVNEAYRVLGDPTRRRAYDQPDCGLSQSLYGSYLDAAHQVLLRRGWTIGGERPGQILLEKPPHRALIVFCRADWGSIVRDSRELRATAVVGLWPDAEFPLRPPVSPQIILVDLVSSRCRWTAPPDPELQRLLEPLAGPAGRK